MKGWSWRTYPRSGFSFQGNMRTYPRSGFRSGGTSECTLVPVFVPVLEHPPKLPSFWKPPFWEPPNLNLTSASSGSPTTVWKPRFTYPWSHPHQGPLPWASESTNQLAKSPFGMTDSKFKRIFSGRKKEPKPKLFGPDIFG